MSSAVQCPTLVYEVIPDHFAAGTGVSPLVAARAHLGHLASLGVDALALTPLLPGHEAPELKALTGAMFVLYVIGAALQVRRLKARGK